MTGCAIPRYDRRVTVHVFYNPDLVGQLAACGITAQRQTTTGAPRAGFVLEGRRNAARARPAVTNVIAALGNVTITGPRQLAAAPTALALPASTATTPQTALELVEECARLRRDNQRLTSEIGRLRGEIDRLTGAPPPRQREPIDLDDSAKRFSLLELE